MEITEDVKKGRLKSAFLIEHFDKAKEILESKGYRMASLQESAILRMQEGLDSNVSKMSFFTREGVLYLPTGGIYLVRNSPILDNAEEATNCYINGRRFYLTDEQVEKSIADSVEFKSTRIPTDRFADEPITAFSFENAAKPYGQFLKEAGIDSIETYVADISNNVEDYGPFHKKAGLNLISTYSAAISNRPFARQIRLNGISQDGRSSIDGKYGLNPFLNLVYGVRPASSLSARLKKIVFLE